jgi:AbrB family looped-hinge helix DNA binding protein
MEQIVAVVSTKGQLAIPKALRERLHLRQGTHVTLTVEGDEIRIRKADDWLSLRGLLASSRTDATAALLEERRRDQVREK